MTWLRLKEAAEHARVKERTLYAWFAEGLVSYKVGGVVLIDLDELDDFIRWYRRRKLIRRHIGNNPYLQNLKRRLG